MLHSTIGAYNLTAGKRVADSIGETLARFGVKYVFGLPGDKVNTLADGVARAGLRFIVVRDEGAGATAAGVMSMLTGGLGACLGMGAPGAVRMLPGLYGAMLDGLPVVALTGQVESFHIGTDYTQEIDTTRLFSAFTVYNHLLVTGSNASLMISRACRAALVHRGVAHVSVPTDIQSEVVEQVEAKYPGPPTMWRPEPREDSVEAAAKILNSADRILILAGRGAVGHGNEIKKLSRKLHAPVFTTRSTGASVMPIDLDHNMGVLIASTIMGRAPLAVRVGQRADAVLLIGTDYPYMSEAFRSDAKVIQIDTNPANIGKRIGVDVQILADAGVTIALLNRQVTQRRGLAFLNEVRQETQENFQMTEEMKNQPSKPITHYYLTKILEDSVGENAIVVTDSGPFHFKESFRVKKHLLLMQGRYQGMGFGMPAAIAAQLVYPKREVVLAEGDASFLQCMEELMTAVQNNLPIKVVVFNNGTNAGPKFAGKIGGVGSDLIYDIGHFNFAKFAEACGVYGRRVDDPRELRRAMDDVLSKKTAAVLDVITAED